MPAYIIVSDATLLEMATYLPQNLDELRMISGFGDVKIAKYGEAFLQTIKTYCGEWNLSSKIKHKIPKRERKARPAATNNGTRSSNTAMDSFSLFRLGKTVTEIAAERGLSPMTIEGHLSYYIYTGEIGIQEIVDEKKKLLIKDAVESYGADKLAPLKEILGEDVSYGEIKAVIAWMRNTGTI